MLKNNFQTKIQYFNVSISVSTNNHQLNKKILQYSKLFDPISKKCNDNWKLGAMVTKQYKQYIPKSNVFEYELEHKEKCNASYKGNNLCIWNKDFLIIKKRKSIKIYTFSIKKMEDLVSKIVRQIFSYSPNMPYSMKIHASACSIQNIGIMFIGVKGAGKTTSLLSILDNIDAHYIGNDIIEARQFENKILLNGWPAACLIGKGTLENINKYRYLLSSNLNKKQFPKVLISFSQIEKLLKTRIVRHIQLKYVFFPILNLNKVHSSIIKLRPSKSFVKENMFCLEDEHPDWLNINPKKELYQSINEIKSWRELKFFKIQLGSSSSLASKKIYNLIRKDVK